MFTVTTTYYDGDKWEDGQYDTLPEAVEVAKFIAQTALADIVLAVRVSGQYGAIETFEIV